MGEVKFSFKFFRFYLQLTKCNNLLLLYHNPNRGCGAKTLFSIQLRGE